MYSLSTEKSSLFDRMEKVERQNRRLKRYLAVLTLLLLPMALMGAKAGPLDGEFRQIVTQKISIVDGAGKEMMRLGWSDEGTGLVVLNKAGNKVLSLGINADERGAGMMVADKTGMPRFGVGMDSGLPSLAITDAKGKKILAMGGDEQGYGLVVMDGNEVERAGIGFKDGSTGILLYDDRGQFVRGMNLQEDGYHYFGYVDENGELMVLR